MVSRFFLFCSVTMLGGRKYWSRSLALVCVLVLMRAPTFAQQRHFSDFTIENGLPYSGLTDVFQDRSGYLWICTNGGGLARYDGADFTYYSSKNGLPSNVITCGAEDASGRIWVGTNNGLACIVADSAITYSDTSEIAGKQCHAIKVAQDGTIWLGTDGGLSSIDAAGRISNVAPEAFKGVSVIAIEEDPGGNLWIGTAGKGLFSGNETFKVHAISATVATVHAIKLVNGAQLYIGTEQGAIVLEAGGAQRVVKSTVGHRVHCILEREDGSVWLGTNENGILQLVQSSTQQISQADGLIDSHVTALSEDREGNVWVASNAGLQRYGGGRFSNYSLPEMVDFKGAKKLLHATNGDLWIGTWGNGLYRFDGHEYHNYTAENGLSHNNVLGITEDSNGQVWIATNIGLSRFNAATENFTTWFEDDGLPQNVLISIHADNDGNVWLGTFSSGLVRFDGTTFTQWTTEQGLINNAVWDIEIDRMQRVWCATDGGFSMFNGSSFENYSSANGLPLDAGLLVKQAPDGTMWLGLDEGGLAKIVSAGPDPKYELFNMDHGLYNNSVVALEFDHRGNAWIGTSRGVDRLNLVDFHKTGNKTFQHYDKSDGFLGVECNQNAIVRGTNGNMWFGTIKGAVKYNPAFDVENTHPPQTHLTGLDLYFNEVDWAAEADSVTPTFQLPLNLSLPHNKNHLTFHFTAISLTVPERVRYKYRLAGFDETWTPETQNQEATYSNLPPGEFTFQLIACNNDGVWNETPTELSFTIQTPFYATWWFYTLCVLLVAAGVTIYVTLRTRALRQAKVRLQKMVKEATVEIVEQRDEIALKNKDITDSIEYAKTLQEAILPTPEAMSAAIGPHFVMYHPRDIVSGDFYWFHERDDLVMIAAADCTGHGVPGAFVSMMGHNMLNEIVGENSVTDPGVVLSELNRKVRHAFQQTGSGRSATDGMDIAICTIDRKNKSIRFSGAMNPLVLVHNGEPNEFTGERNPIGGRTPYDFSFATQTVPYEDGATIYMYSDGYPDQFGGAKGKKFMTRKFRALLTQIAAWAPNEQLAHLEQTLSDWRGDYDQVDDVLVIGIRL